MLRLSCKSEIVSAQITAVPTPGKPYLLSVSHSPEEKGHAKNKEKVGQDRSQEGGLDDTNFVLEKGQTARRYLPCQHEAHT